MFKLICIENNLDGYIFSDIEIGNMYDGEEFDRTDRYYKIYNNTGEPDMKYNVHLKSFFLRVAEWRERQIDSILKDEEPLQENV